MKFRAVELNRLDEETIANIRIWRNQDFVRKNMFHSHIITEEEHKRYIDKMKQDPNRRLFVFYLDGKPFGVTQYDADFKQRILKSTSGAYLIDEEYQAMGYGVILYHMGYMISYHHFGLRTEYVEIIDNNKSALALFYQKDYILDETYKKSVLIEGEKHEVYRLIGEIKPYNNNTKIEKMMKRLIDQEPMEDMLVL